MKHTITYAAIFFCAGCIAADHDGADVGAEGDAITVRPAPRPLPTSPKPTDPPPAYTWTSDGVTYDFDAYDAYGANLVNSGALLVRVPGVYAGDQIRIEVAGAPYAEHPEADVLCDLRVHATDGLGSEAPLSVGGSIGFTLDAEPQTHVTAVGYHTVAASGTTRLRILGRVSRPDRFCGLQGAITIRATVR